MADSWGSLCQPYTAMISFKLFLFIYLLGGITFIPLLLVTSFLIYKKWFNNEGSEEDDDERQPESAPLLVDIDPEFKAGKLEENIGVDASKQGWLVITNQYYHHPVELMNRENMEEAVLQRSQLKKKQRYYTVLKHGNPFLYRSESLKSDLVHAISLKDMFVTIWPRKPGHELPDGSLFTSRTCIALFKTSAVQWVSSDGLDSNQGTLKFASNTFDGMLQRSDEQVDLVTSNANQFYLYVENTSEKEDWYFQLINATKMGTADAQSPLSALNPIISADVAHFNTADMLYLIQAINSTKGQLTTKWLNALLGRLFLALQHTDTLNNYLLDRVYKKLNKIRKPGFLDDFVIEKLDAGHSVPFITDPKLIELSPEGKLKLSLNMMYKGGLIIVIATKGNINLGSRFRQREVSIKLSITVKEVTGPMEVIIKPPPSNRIWYAFTKDPVLDLEIEPVVSSNKLSYSVITNAIKSKFAEAIKESLVVPFYDDIVFYSTEHDVFRGGIWSKKRSSESSTKVKPEPSNVSPAETPLPAISESTLSANYNEEVVTQTSQGGLLNPLTTSTSSLNAGGLKARTIQKATTIKNALKSSSAIKTVRSFPAHSSSNSGVNQSSDDEINGSNAETTGYLMSQTSNDEHLSDDLAESSTKRIFKSSIKKINKWVKDKATKDGGDSSDFDDLLQPDDTLETASASRNETFSKLTGQSDIYQAEIPRTPENSGKSTVPKMISSRRRPRPPSDLITGLQLENLAGLATPQPIRPEGQRNVSDASVASDTVRAFVPEDMIASPLESPAMSANRIKRSSMITDTGYDMSNVQFSKK